MDATDQSRPSKDALAFHTESVSKHGLVLLKTETKLEEKALQPAKGRRRQRHRASKCSAANAPTTAWACP
jgi:hypothetical protein